MRAPHSSLVSLSAPASALAFVLTLTGCGASFPPPTDQYAAAQRDLGRAQEGGAQSVPQAKLHLQLAQENMAKAKELMDKDNKHATTLVARATAEATLALALAREAQARADAAQQQELLDKMKAGSK